MQTIILADKSIRFAGIANKFGKKVISEYRDGLVPLMTEAESELVNQNTHSQPIIK